MKTLHLLFSALLLAGVTIAPATVYAGDHEKKDTTHDGTHGDHKDDKGKKGEHDGHDKGHGKGEKHSGIHSQDEMRASMGGDDTGSQNRQRGDQITEELNRRNLQQGGMNQQQLNQQQMNQQQGQGSR